jgi:S1-C subfamily serine protease
MVLGAACAAGGMYLYSNGVRLGGLALGQSPAGPAAVTGGIGDLTALSDRFEAVARNVLPAVVSIEAKKTMAANPNSTSRTAEDSGSGVLVASADGQGTVVLTNFHVVKGARPDQVSVILADGRGLKTTQVLGDTETDIAVLRVEAPKPGDGSPLPTARLGDSDRARIGQWVLALGSPFGLSQSVTHGIVSARERGQVSLGNSIRVKDFIQTDAAINPGSSGGPLLSLNGEVIGINTAIASHSGSSAGVSFSIPINLVKRVAKQLQERGAVTHGVLGLTLDPNFDPGQAAGLGLDRSRGARVTMVWPDSPAAKAGLKSNDVVLQLDSVTIRNDNHLINLISMLPPGQKVTLTVWRERKTYAVETVVGDWTTWRERQRTAQ